jgi:hypothetical protein
MILQAVDAEFSSAFTDMWLLTTTRETWVLNQTIPTFHLVQPANALTKMFLKLQNMATSLFNRPSIRLKRVKLLRGLACQPS